MESQQQDQQVETPETPQPKAVGRQGNVTADAEQKRRVQGLQLQRERILSERTASPHRRSALAAALTDIEEQLSELGWTLHL